MQLEEIAGLGSSVPSQVEAGQMNEEGEVELWVARCILSQGPLKAGYMWPRPGMVPFNHSSHHK